MTTIFVSAATGNNANNGTTWALAKQTVNGGLVIAANGDVVVVDNAGTFTANAAITWQQPVNTNVAIISVLRSGTVGFTWATGATESVGAANNAFTISSSGGSSNQNQGHLYVWGMSINGGTNNNAACNIQLLNINQSGLILDTCTLDLPTVNDRTVLVSTNAILNVTIKLVNCTLLNTGNVSGGRFQYFDMGKGTLEVINCTFSLAFGVNRVLGFQSTSDNVATVVFRDCDFSAQNTAGQALVRIDSIRAPTSVLFENTKIGSNIAAVEGTWANGGMNVTLRNVTSGSDLYTFQYMNAYGTLTASNTIYVTSGGAAFNNAGVSWQIVTTSFASEATPFITPAVFVWDTTLTAQTASMEIIRDNATNLTDRDIWSDLDSAASASFPNYTYQSNRNVNPFTGTAADQPTSTASWTGVGGFGTQNKQKLQNAFTAAAPGLLQSRISVAVASTTLYVDPFVGGVS